MDGPENQAIELRVQGLLCFGQIFNVLIFNVFIRKTEIILYMHYKLFIRQNVILRVEGVFSLRITVWILTTTPNIT